MENKELSFIEKPNIEIPIHKESVVQEKIDLNIFSNQRKPDGIAKNHEYLMMDIIKRALCLKEEYVPGDVRLGEPDFVNLERTNGYEMTFIDNRDGKSIIEWKKIGGAETFSFKDNPVMEWIRNAFEIKSNKQYSVKDVFLVAMFPCCIEDLTHPYCLLNTNKLNNFFYNIYCDFIKDKGNIKHKRVFKDIYMIIPTPNQKMTIYILSHYCDLNKFEFPQSITLSDHRYFVL